jgi:serine/threonine protein kinase/tetratricopeptide (TPR) repeat protein
LKGHVATAGLLDAPDRAGSTADRPPTPDGPGTVIGPYTLREQIGEGGMGVVYVAEQSRPVRRKVALKIIKPGMDTKQVVARFEAERQALALMDHPNIARVHDAGATESGRPYFVMELVRGIPITDYCDRERLSIPERLELFVLVCRAVQHAHQKGIIHRDLKPSNILVTVIDGVAAPKVIDFGVAKATGGSLTERTLYTGFAQLIGTPLYMSPEQADLSGVDVDTRSDIYSLGVLLYELLTGTTPFDQETLRQAAFDEVRRIIREQEPPKPSTRLSSLGAARATVSANRKADARHLDRAVRGELDWIVIKALEKDRRRRYETANDFAGDVMRFLTDRPVEAGPPSAWYRLRKFVRRNRRRLASAIILLASGLLVGCVLLAVRLNNVSRVRQVTQDVRQALAGARTAIEAGDLTLGGQRVSEAQGRLGADGASLPDQSAEIGGIRREIDARQADAARFSQFLKGASDVQDKMSYGYEAGGPAGLQTGEHVAEEVLRLYGILTEKDWLSRLENSYLTADQKQQVRETAYVTLVSLADFAVRWNWKASRLDPSLAARSAARSLDLLQRAQAFHQPTRAFYFVRAECRRRQGDTAAAAEDEKQFRAATARTAWDYFLPGHTAGWGGDLDEAIRSYEAALRLQPNHFNSLYFLAMRLATDKINRWPEAIAYYTACIALRPDHFGANISRGACYKQLGRLDGAEADFEAARALAKDDADRCHFLYELANLYVARREYSKAEPLLVQALEIGRRVLGEDHPTSLKCMHIQAHLHKYQRNFAQAEPLLVRVLEVGRRVLGEEVPDTLHVMECLAGVYSEQGKLAQAEPLLVHALEGLRRVLGEEHRATFLTMNGLACLYMKQGKLAQAELLFVKALEVGRRVLGEEDGDTLVNMNNLAQVYLLQEKLAQAEPLFVKALGVRRRVFGEEHPDTLNSMNSLAGLYIKQGKLAQAEPLLVQALEVGRRAGGEEYPNTLTTMHRLFELYFLQGKLAQAEPLAIKVLEGLRRVQREEHPDTLHAMENLAQLYEKLGDLTRAEPLQVKVLEIRRRVQGEQHPDTLRVINNLAVWYWLNGKLDRSVPLFEDLLKCTRARLGQHHAETIQAMVNLGTNYRDAGRLPEGTELLEQARAEALKQPDFPVDSLASISRSLGESYERAGQFAKAESLCRETLETARQRHKGASSQSTALQVVLAENLIKQRRYAEAEPLLRECLKFREQNEPGDWTTFNTRSMLGGSLLGQKKYADSEPLLLAGYEGMKEREAKIPPIGKFRLTEAIERLAQLYEAWGKLEKAAEWRAKLPPAAEELPNEVFARP